MKLSSLKTNKEKELNGVWREAGEGLQLLLARAGNQKFQTYFRRLTQPYQASIRRGKMDDEVLVQLTNKAGSHTILLGWKNLQDDAGKDIEYSPEKAEELLNSTPDFAKMVYELANDMAFYQDEVAKETKGN